ncbi:hypothetical protein MBANPS3_001047 [Mucor bainieri]
MSPPWTTLPQELLRKVFSEIDGKDILNLQHVCQAWRPAAQEKLYSSIRITGNGSSREQHLAQTLCTPGNKAINYVKKITISPLDHNKSLNCMSLFYQLLYRLRETQHLQKLQVITAPCTEVIDDYCELMLLLKNSATDISICSSTNPAISEHNSIIEAFPLAKHLKEFVSLERIVITTSVYLTLTQLGELLDMCPSTKVRAVELHPQQIGRKHQSRLLSAASQVNVQPQRELVATEKFAITQKTLLGDQDLQYIMKKFPALHVLFLVSKPGAHSNDEQGSIQSADIAIAFVKYLWRIPSFDFESLRTTPEIMSKIIAQTLKCGPVNSMRLRSSRRQKLPIFSATKYEYDEEDTMKLIKIGIPTHLESLYQHAIQAFSSHVKDLHLQGSSWDYERAVYFPLDDKTEAESKTLVSSLEYAINNYPGLKTLQLRHTVFFPTHFNTAFKRKSRLDNLVIIGCLMEAETWDMLSKRLKRVTRFMIDLYNWDLINPLEEDVYMPHTTFRDIKLYKYPFRFAKICTNTTTMYIDFKGEYHMDEPERLTEQQYNDIRLNSDTPNEYCQKIICRDCRKVIQR